MAGCPTTAGCPGFTRRAERDATVVERLRAAGAIVVGKANLDQFATGLVGTRSPYGVPPNALRPDLVPGGSSSGSAVAVALGAVPFALGTDTAGSGRVPAALNGIVGLKPTPGRVSTAGIVPAVRRLDCPSVFARSPADAGLVLEVLEGPDAADAYSCAPPGVRPLRWPPRVGVPAAWPASVGLEAGMRGWFGTAVDRLARLGCPLVADRPPAAAGAGRRAVRRAHGGRAHGRRRFRPRRRGRGARPGGGADHRRRRPLRGGRRLPGRVPTGRAAPAGGRGLGRGGRAGAADDRPAGDPRRGPGRSGRREQRARPADLVREPRRRGRHRRPGRAGRAGRAAAGRPGLARRGAGPPGGGLCVGPAAGAVAVRHGRGGRRPPRRVAAQPPAHGAGRLVPGAHPHRAVLSPARPAGHHAAQAGAAAGGAGRRGDRGRGVGAGRGRARFVPPRGAAPALPRHGGAGRRLLPPRLPVRAVGAGGSARHHPPRWLAGVPAGVGRPVGQRAAW